MDAPRNLASRIILCFCVLLSGHALAGERPEPITRPLVILGADAEHARQISWAFERFRAAGLDGLPPIEVHLHPSRDDCKGRLGSYRAGRIELCTMDSSDPYAKKFALHEMAHAWTEANVDHAMEARFMRLREVDAWNGADLAWKERGIEQAAEIVAWGLGEGNIQPLLPEPAETQELIDAYVLLTGNMPITPASA
jgi:hypothetical protein